MSKSLKKVLKKIVSKDLNEKLAVADAKLGNSVKVTFDMYKMTVQSDKQQKQPESHINKLCI